MPAAFLPSPSRALWHLGPIPVRAYAICVVLGVAAGLWVAERQYRRVGGRPGMIWDIATVAVPAGLVGARLYGVLSRFEQYFGRGHDWTDMFRVWDGGLGVPGAVAGGVLGARLVCRRERAALGTVAGAAAPGLAFAQAIGCWGNWFGQQLYGRPTTLPWGVEIALQHRPARYVNFATFQPTFLYESLWGVLTGVLVIYLARRLRLPGGRTFAGYAILYAFGRFWTVGLQIGYSPHLFELRVDQVVMILIAAAAAGYLYLTRQQRGPGGLGPADRGRSAGAGSPGPEGAPASGSPGSLFDVLRGLVLASRPIARSAQATQHST